VWIRFYLLECIIQHDRSAENTNPYGSTDMYTCFPLQRRRRLSDFIYNNNVSLRSAGLLLRPTLLFDVETPFGYSIAFHPSLIPAHFLLRFPRERNNQPGIHTTFSYGMNMYSVGPVCVYTSCGLKSNTGSRVHFTHTHTVSAHGYRRTCVLFDVSRQDRGG